MGELQSTQQPPQDGSHLAAPQAPSQVHISSSPSVDKNLTFLPQQQQPHRHHHHQRGRTGPHAHSGATSPHSAPGSRATSRSRISRHNSHSHSRPSSRPVSWLIHANSEYTSMYDNYGGTRSRRNSYVGEDGFSAAEKGVHGRVSRKSSYAGGLSTDGSSEKQTMDSTRPEMLLQHSSTTSSFTLKDIGQGLDQHAAPRGNVSALKASFLLGKAFVGTGVLFLPSAFKNGGILFSCLMLAAVALICCVAFLLLVKVRLVVRENFQDMGAVLFGKYMRLAVLISVAISQIGFVCAYLIFVSENLFAVVQTFTKCTFDGISEKYYILIPLVVLIPLVLIRRMAVLSVPSMLANLFIIFGIVYLWYYSINSLVHRGVGPNIGLFNKDDFALFIGTAVFSFEGIGLIIPITESMAEPEKFPRVLAITMTIVALIFGSIGALCYASFGSDIQTIVLLNLPIRDGMTITVEILYSLAIILSVPLMLSPASRIFEYGIFGDKSGGQFFKVKMQKNALRIVLIICCALLAFGIGGPNLDKFVSFVGSVACMPLCFIFPAMFHYKACATTMRAKVLDIALGIFGAAVMVFTLYITIRSWVVPGTHVTPLDRCTAFA
ncbi:transmembrane amino acid transporter protein-domain-containing protein [Gamsiella multidivaricata]|uniref:transmembrane amino acid transporter protein-domain-containing protein n=1 Tax=Gamsiella multidivaricata TaxID=101098 RepID=UPI00221F43BC|nr:transmembrane amino acid transporter protein-domain-containing protein [Gamsiella multidivaricata]KAI7824785.1 transmembrane amino acid transporter protein-domain-containing protein [Gamsiella multidivaricata]